MSHIADLYTTGRRGQHQTIDQARGAYSQLIMKEQAAADNAFRRQLASRLGVKCPACTAQVSTPKCHLCGYYPIAMPTMTDLGPTVAGSAPPAGGGDWDSASDAARGGPRRGAASSRGGSVCSSGNRSRMTSASEAAFEERVSRLESMIERERAERGDVLQQVECLKELLQKTMIRPDGDGRRAVGGNAGATRRRPVGTSTSQEQAKNKGGAVGLGAKKDAKHPAPANWLPSVSGGKPPRR